LSPTALRRRVAAVLLRLAMPLPRSVAAKLRAVATSTPGCGCSGCDRNPVGADQAADSRSRSGTTAATIVAQPITLHRRLPR
jgi:hypothetical protein